jgi:cobalt/nickel transport system ATP-binding protein
MMIQLQNISFRYPDRTEALSNITLRVREGEKLVIAGANGAGKSTLFLILNGILKPMSGHYVFDGKQVKYSKADLLQLRKNVGIVFQEPDSQIFSASVIDEVSFGPLNLGLPHHQVREQVDMALTALDIAHLQNRPAHLLSYGQKKRVTMASVLSMNPRILIFDEPTSGLDPVHAAEIVALLHRLHQQGKTIIISTHDMNLAYQWASRIVVLNQGQVLGDGSPADIFSNPSLIGESGLELPMILQVYKALGKSHWPAPATIDELVAHIHRHEDVQMLDR